jgi:uncharacterized protein (TIGR02265 family)
MVRITASELTVDLELGFSLLGLERRLADTPATAHTRGLFFRIAAQAVAERSRELMTVWRVASGAHSRWPFSLYSTRELIRELAVAAVLLEPADPGHALRQMWTITPKLSPLIRADRFMRYLTGSKPMQALTWLAQNRRMMADYGDWWLVPTGTNSATFHYQSEYTWLEHCHVGGLEGTLRRCGVMPVVTAELDDPYHGRLMVRWT